MVGTRRHLAGQAGKGLHRRVEGRTRIAGARIGEGRARRRLGALRRSGCGDARRRHGLHSLIATPLRYGDAAESVTGRKLALMHRAALGYLTRELGRDDLPCRLEVLTIQGPAATGELTLLDVEG